jgi:hypothetical protein
MNRTVTTVFRGAIRRVNSQAGNPAWGIVTDVGVYRTETDAALNHRIENALSGGPEGFLDLDVRLELTTQGRVIGITAVTSGRQA